MSLEKSWFEQLTGLVEKSPEQVREQLILDGDRLTSRANGRTMICGRLETPSLADLRSRVKDVPQRPAGLKVREVVADVQKLHVDAANTGAMFQVASQFNLLEMTGPNVTPEEGVAIYELDRTQGPACAIAVGAGTIFRNYFVPVNGRPGQSEGNQIDCLADVGRALGNENNRLWKMQNGYALASLEGLQEINSRWDVADEATRDGLREKLRIGWQRRAEVTLDGAGHCVSQAFCSALPVSYSRLDALKWERFGRLILEAAYEATLCATIVEAAEGGGNRLFLTLLGGGAFGNPVYWILDAMERALLLYRNYDLDVAIVSRGASNPHVSGLADQFAR